MSHNSSAIRTILIAAGALLLAALAALALNDATPTRAARSVMLVYVGARDCAPCKAWRHGDWRAFRDSLEFRRLVYREIESPSLYDVLKDDNWPEDLRGYRRAIDEGAGVPLWLVIADDKIVMRAFGLAQWRGMVLPKIKSLLP